jgi:hypothetical protein
VQSTPWYVHHNIFDQRSLRVVDMGGKDPYPMSQWQPHSPTGSNPLKIFNNTFIMLPDMMDQMSRLPAHERTG